MVTNSLAAGCDRAICRGRGAREYGSVRVGIAPESVRPGFSVHTDAWSVTAFIPETFIQVKGSRYWIEVHDEQAVLSVFTGV